MADAAPHVLLADDDRSIRVVVTEALEQAGFRVTALETLAALRARLDAGEGDAAVLDVLMPDANGLDILPELQALRPDLPLIVISAQNTLSTAVRATERGAYDYLPKPFDLESLERCLRQALGDRAAAPAAGPGTDTAGGIDLIGRSPRMQSLYKAMARLMNTDLTVLITGESGTGKELVARALHGMGHRREGPFVAVNMAAIPRELIESELFGHEKGAFTGADARHVGRFEQAHGGTLFLDEIGDMPLQAQTRLLRVLQQGEFTRIGGAAPIRSDLRIVAASNAALEDLVAAGEFRKDLYFRLNVVPLTVPPLRERTEDIAPLVAHFLRRAVQEGLPEKQLSDAALARLRAYRWPGNVRELENAIRRLCVLAVEGLIGPATLVACMPALEEAPAAESGAPGNDGLGAAVERALARYFDAHGAALPPPGIYGRVLREVEKPLIRATLEATGGNQLRAAELLGLNRNTLRKKIRELGLHSSRKS